MPRADSTHGWMDRNRWWVLLTSPTLTFSPSILTSPRISVVLPEPISPVNTQNDARDSIAYSSIVRAAECCCEGYKNAGSGFMSNGFELKLKWFRYIAL